MNVLSPDHGNAAIRCKVENEQWATPVGKHRFEAALCPESEGGFSIFAVHYPGVISCGDTDEQAKENIADAFLAMLEARRSYGEDMHYSQEPVAPIPAGCTRVLITATSQ